MHGSSGELGGADHRRMKLIEVWQWKLRCSVSGRLVRSRWKMTETEALERDPAAQKMPGTMEVWPRYENFDEYPHSHSTAFGNPNGPKHGAPDGG